MIAIILIIVLLLSVAAYVLLQLILFFGAEDHEPGMFNPDADNKEIRLANGGKA